MSKSLSSTQMQSRTKMKQETVWLMAVTCALAVANLYYNQPLLAAIAQSFHASASQVGWIPTLTQLGYASGLLLFAPLGDCLERRRLIVTMLLITAAAMLAAAVSPTLEWLTVTSYIIGATTIAAQLVLPFAAQLAEPTQQGKVIGNLMSALFVGILLARPAGGYIGATLGWRSIYAIAGGLMVILALASMRWLPKSKPSLTLSYGQLLQSLWGLIQSQPILRSASAIQAMLFGVFSAFWSTLAFLLAQPPYFYGSDIAGLFGFVGISGIVAAPILGKLADRGSQRIIDAIVGLSITISVISYLLFWQFSQQLWGLILGIILLNLSTQGALVANQVQIYSLLPEARNRLNTVYMVSTFIGASVGSVVGTYGWSLWRWPGVCVTGLGLIGVAGIIFLGKILQHRKFPTPPSL